MLILGLRAANWPLLAAGAVLFGLAGFEPAAAQELRLKVVDQTSRSPEFSAFHKGLLEAVKRRDTNYVVDRASADIKLSFGDDYGRDTFREWLARTEGGQGEQYWRELQSVLELGGVFMEDGAFCAPYLACMDVPGCPECDPYEMVFVTKAKAVARIRPSETAEIAAKLSWNVLYLDYEAEGTEGWYRVKLPDGQTGFVNYDDARMAVDYRARFEKTGDGWRMTVFIAGD